MTTLFVYVNSATLTSRHTATIISMIMSADPLNTSVNNNARRVVGRYSNTSATTNPVIFSSS